MLNIWQLSCFEPFLTGIISPPRKAALSFICQPLTLWCQFSAESLCAGPVRPVSPEEFAFPLVKITFLQWRWGLIKVLCSPFCTAYWRHLDFHATGIRITGEESGARRSSLCEPKAILTWLVGEEVSGIVSSRREGRRVPKSLCLLMATQTRIKGRIRTGHELWLPCIQVTVAFESREVTCLSPREGLAQYSPLLTLHREHRLCPHVSHQDQLFVRNKNPRRFTRLTISYVFRWRRSPTVTLLNCSL